MSLFAAQGNNFIISKHDFCYNQTAAHTLDSLYTRYAGNPRVIDKDTPPE